MSVYVRWTCWSKRVGRRVNGMMLNEQEDGLLTKQTHSPLPTSADLDVSGMNLGAGTLTGPRMVPYSTLQPRRK